MGIEPKDALGIAAQVAVTLAGFAGVVVIFRPGLVHEWSPVDRFRLRLLLGNSIFPLAYSLFGMLLLTMKPSPDSIWRWCSAFAVVCQFPVAITSIKRMRTFSPADFKQVSKIVFYPIVRPRKRGPYIAILQSRCPELVLALLCQHLRSADRCDGAVRPARSTASGQG